LAPDCGGDPLRPLPTATGRAMICPMEIELREDSDIDVTPAMIEAGLAALAHFDPGEDPPETWGESVSEIYRAMDRARVK
jgi:hypothetical protein